MQNLCVMNNFVHILPYYTMMPLIAIHLAHTDAMAFHLCLRSFFREYLNFSTIIVGFAIKIIFLILLYVVVLVYIMYDYILNRKF